MHTMRSTIQQDILAGKATFERWYATFVVKIDIYHADNGIFSKQPFRSAIDDPKQKIKNWVEHRH